MEEEKQALQRQLQLKHQRELEKMKVSTVFELVLAKLFIFSFPKHMVFKNK